MVDLNVPYLNGGVNRGVPRDQIPPNQVTDMDDIVIVDGVPQKRTGYTAMTNTDLTGTTFLGGYHYQDGVSGKKRFWAFTTAGAYYRSVLTGGWTSGIGSASFAATPALDQYITYTEIVELDDYKNYLLVCENHTNPLTALNGTSKIWYTSEPETGLAVLVGGADYNATGDASVDYHVAKQAIAFADHLLLLNTYEETSAGAWKSLFYRIRWSDVNHFTQSSLTGSSDWDSVNTDGAGYQDLRTSSGAILRGELLGDTLAVYLQKAIYQVFHTTSSTQPFRFLCMVPSVGLLSPRLIVPTMVGHFFVGNDKQIYLYEGGKALTPIGDPVRTEFFSNLHKGPSSTSTYLIRDRAFGIHFKDMNCVGFSIPTGSTADVLASAPQTPDTMYIYDYYHGKWLDKWTTSAEFTGFGEWENPTSQSAMTLPILGNYTYGGVAKTYIWDYSTATDANTAGAAVAITGAISTQEYIIDVGKEYTTVNVWFDAKGSSTSAKLTVATKTDDGSWDTTNAKQVSLTAAYASYHVVFNVTGYALRLKFYDATSGQIFYLGKVKVEQEDVGIIP